MLHKSHTLIILGTLAALRQKHNNTMAEMGEQIEEYLKKDLINIIGGCCGTSPEHIRVIANIAAKYKPRRAELVSASH